MKFRLAVLLSVAALAVVAAQTPQTPQTSQTPQTAPTSATPQASPTSQTPQSPQTPDTQVQGPTFRTGIDLVAVDVAVIDRNGRPVEDLRAPDFSVKIDGAQKSGNAPVTATVVAAYHCRVPLVGGLVCGLFTAGTDAMNVRFLSRAATLPNQGASYDM